MALYDTLFSQLDVTSAQLLVTDNDFRSPEFRKQLTETVDSLLSLKVIPVFNENDSISTRRAPYEVSDLLEYKVSSTEVQSNFSSYYATYIKEKLENTITFGDKSRLGRGGMTAKVKAAVYASQAGILVVITRVCRSSSGMSSRRTLRNHSLNQRLMKRRPKKVKRRKKKTVKMRRRGRKGAKEYDDDEDLVICRVCKQSKKFLPQGLGVSADFVNGSFGQKV